MLKFKWEKLSSLLGHTVVRYTEESTITDPPTDPFVIEASPYGVEIRGKSPILSQYGDFEALAKAIGDASKDHIKLKPKMTIE